MSVATEDKLMTLSLVYLTCGSVEGTDNRTSWTSYHCAFQLLRKRPDKTLPAKTSWAPQCDYLRTCRCTGYFSVYVSEHCSTDVLCPPGDLKFIVTKKKKKKKIICYLTENTPYRLQRSAGCRYLRKCLLCE